MELNQNESRDQAGQPDRQTPVDYFNEIFQDLYTYFFYRTGQVSLTEKLVTEVFLQVAGDLNIINSLAQGTRRSRFFSIAHGLTVDIKAENRVWQNAPVGLTNSFPPVAEIVPGRNREVFRLFKMVETLSPDFRNVLSLKYFAKLSNRDIAGILDKTLQEVEEDLCRATEELYWLYLEEITRPNEELA